MGVIVEPKLLKMALDMTRRSGSPVVHVDCEHDDEMELTACNMDGLWFQAIIPVTFGDQAYEMGWEDGLAARDLAAAAAMADEPIEMEHDDAYVSIRAGGVRAKVAVSNAHVPRPESTGAKKAPVGLLRALEEVSAVPGVQRVGVTNGRAVGLHTEAIGAVSAVEGKIADIALPMASVAALRGLIPGEVAVSGTRLMAAGSVVGSADVGEAEVELMRWRMNVPLSGAREAQPPDVVSRIEAQEVGFTITVPRAETLKAERWLAGVAEPTVLADGKKGDYLYGSLVPGDNGATLTCTRSTGEVFSLDIAVDFVAGTHQPGPVTVNLPWLAWMLRQSAAINTTFQVLFSNKMDVPLVLVMREDEQMRYCMLKVERQ